MQVHAHGVRNILAIIEIKPQPQAPAVYDLSKNSTTLETEHNHAKQRPVQQIMRVSSG
jgi:hypothetical protein